MKMSPRRAKLLGSLAAVFGMTMDSSNAWVSPTQQPARVSRTGGARQSCSLPITRWDAQLARARDAHRRQKWAEVELWCGRVIGIADDWNALEQAHLRLALAAQKRTGVDGARRAFQQGIEDCPSSDTLLLAWALMESKVHNARSRKIARALLRRAVALNPKKNWRVLKWSVFAGDLNWIEAAGGAAVGVVRSALSPAVKPPVKAATPPTSASVPTSGWAPPAAGAAATAALAAAATANVGGSGGSGGGGQVEGSITRAEQKQERGLAIELLELCRSGRALRTQGEDLPQREDVVGADHEAPSSLSSLSSSSLFSRTSLPMATAAVDAVAAAPAAAVATAAAPSARFEELAKELERRGDGAAERGGRELCGSWRLVFTTCGECDRVLKRTGSEVYQRLTPPITAIQSGSSSKRAAPFRCEVLLRPSPAAAPSFTPRPRWSPAAPPGSAAATDANCSRAGGDFASGPCEVTASLPPPPTSSPPSLENNKQEKTPTKAARAAVAYLLRGWADTKPGPGGSLIQHVAPRFATVILGSGSRSDGDGDGDSGAAKRAARVPSPTPPPAVFSSLGSVSRGGRGPERLATQEVTYVGRQLRIGRTKGGDVYVYERCAWPGGVDLGLSA